MLFSIVPHLDKVYALERRLRILRRLATKFALLNSMAYLLVCPADLEAVVVTVAFPLVLSASLRSVSEWVVSDRVRSIENAANITKVRT